MGFTTDDSQVRVDFFKESGKWYTTVSLKWDRYNSVHESGTELIHDTFRRCLREQFPNRFQGLVAVCLEPYHEHAHPLMVKDW